MTKLTITFDMNNAVFLNPETRAHDWLSKISHILLNLADRIYARGVPVTYPLLLRDKNGNLIGEVVLDTEP